VGSCGVGFVGGLGGEVAEAEGFVDVVVADAGGGGEVGDGAGDAEATVVTAGGKAEAVDGGGEEAAGGIGGPAGAVEGCDGQAGIGHARPRVGELAGGGDAGTDGLRRFPRRPGQLGGADAVHADVEIKAVQQGAGEAAFVATDLARYL
jgi:hypothetical protein